MSRRGLFRHVVVVALFAGVFAVGAGQSAVPRKVGEKAPAFELEDTEGKTHELADYEGRIVVLEWTDPDCPYVQRHYDEQEGATMAGTYRKVRDPSTLFLEVTIVVSYEIQDRATVRHRIHQGFAYIDPARFSNTRDRVVVAGFVAQVRG